MKHLTPDWQLTTIGVIRSCFKEKFGIPRQPGLAVGARGTIKLADDPDLRTAIKGLEGFSHVWAIFVFHEHGGRSWKPSIRPPRLGGSKKIGVLASRSPHRPNPIGMSAMAIEAIRIDAEGGAEIDVSGVDVLDGTPVLDLKPYLPYTDSIPEATSGWAHEPIKRIPVIFSREAEAELVRRARAQAPGPESLARLRSLITDILELDPRPAHQKRRLPPGSAEAMGMRFGFNLLDFDVRWEIRGDDFYVFELADLGPDGKPILTKQPR